MCRRNHALHWIVQKQRYAVCIERHKRNSNLLRDESVNLREITFPHDTLSTVVLRHDPQIRLMYLIREHELRVIVPARLRKPSVILHHRRFLIATGKA